MKKRFMVLLLFLTITILFTISAGAESIELNLSRSYQLTLEDNTSLKIAQKELDNKMIQYEKSKAQNLLNQSNYNEIQAEYNLMAARKVYLDTANNLLRETLQKYTNILLKKRNIELIDRQINLNEDRLSEIKSQYEVGEKSQLDILDQQIEVNDLNKEKGQLKNEYEQLKTEFKIQLGLDKDQGIGLSELTKPKYLNLSEEEISSQALENNWNIKMNRLNLELAKIEKKRNEVSSTSEMDKKISENKVHIAQLQIEQQKEELNNRSRELKNQLVNIENNIELFQDRTKKAKDTNEILKQQYDAGLTTQYDLVEGEISVLQSEYQLYSSYMSYYLQKLNIELLMNPEAEVLNDVN
ncbi:MAG: TolC family protein [Halanaerobiales bacterium]|nr:TolC family protein [Halanaerobiales bacterium]